MVSISGPGGEGQGINPYKSSTSHSQPTNNNQIDKRRELSKVERPPRRSFQISKEVQTKKGDVSELGKMPPWSYSVGSDPGLLDIEQQLEKSQMEISNPDNSIQSVSQTNQGDVSGQGKPQWSFQKAPNPQLFPDMEPQPEEPQMHMPNPDNSMPTVSQPGQESNVSDELISLHPDQEGLFDPDIFYSDLDPDSVQQNAYLDRCWEIIADLSKKGKVTFYVAGNSDEGYFNADHLTPQEAVKASAKLSKKDEVTFAVREGKSGTFSYIAENLTPQEAEEKVKLLADLSKIGVKNGDIVSFVAKNLEAEDVAKFIKNLAQGNIDLNKLSEHGWKEAKGEATGFKDSVAELADDVTISVAAGIVAGTLFTVFGQWDL